MIDRKISELTELVTPAPTDLLPIVDVSVDGFETKRITVASLVAGAIGAPANAEYVTLALDVGLSDERVLVGTANQIVVTDGGAGGNVTLSTPQDIAVGSSPTFAGLTINGNITVTGTVDGVDVATLATTVGLIGVAEFVTISADPTLPNERVLTGTANQITVTDGGAGAAVTLSLPQDIDTSADVTFDSLILDDLTALRLVASDVGEKLVSTDLFAWVIGTANRVTVADDADGTITLSSPQDIDVTATPIFAGLTINGNIAVTGTVDGIDIAGIADAQYVVIAADGDLANERILTGTANQIIVTDGGAGLAVTLSTPQDIHTLATPQFDGMTLTGQLLIDGGADEIQLRIQADAAQSANIQTIEDSAGNVLAGFDERGILFSDGGIDVNSIFIGSNAGNLAAVGALRNIGIGTNVLDSLTSGDNNVCAGYLAGAGLTSGGRNVFLGREAGETMSTGNDCMFLGFQAGHLTTGIDNTFIGRGAGALVSNGIRNMLLGMEAGRDSNPSLAVAVGRQAGLVIGSNSVMIGADTGTLSTGVRCIFIGYAAGNKQVAATDLLIIDNRTRADIATQEASSIIHGVMAALPVNQTLRTNARLGVNVAPLAQLHVDQSDNAGAIPVGTFDQADEDYVLWKIIGTAAAASADRTLVADADYGTPGALVGWVQIEIEDIGNRIADADYWMPFYATPT